MRMTWPAHVDWVVGQLTGQHRHVAARAAHVDRQQVAQADLVAQELARHHPGPRPGHQRADGHPHHGARRGRAAVGLHDQHPRVGQHFAEGAGKARDVPRHARAQVGVGDRGGRALVLAELRLTSTTARRAASGAARGTADPAAARARGWRRRTGARWQPSGRPAPPPGRPGWRPALRRGAAPTSPRASTRSGTSRTCQRGRSIFGPWRNRS